MMLSRENIQELWDLMAEIFDDWTRKHGEFDSGAWFAGLRGVNEKQLKFGIARAVESKRPFSPSLPEFKAWCLGEVEQVLEIPNKADLFVWMMNFVAPAVGNAKERDLSQLNPAMYWIYKKIGLREWNMMNLREAREHFYRVYDQCIEAYRYGDKFDPPPVQIETEEQQKEREYKINRKDPAYISKRKQVAMNALAEMRIGL